MPGGHELDLIGLRIEENTTNLNNSQTYSSGWINVEQYASVGFRVYASHNGTYTIYFSEDESTNHTTITYTYDTSLIFTPKVLDVVGKFCKLEFTNNSGVNQTDFQVSIHASPSTKTIKIGRNRTLPLDVDAVPVRLADELDVMRGKIEGEYLITKYARNADIDTGTPEDIWNGGDDYTGFPTASAENFEVLSSDANDTAAGTGARQIRIYYYDDDYNMFDSSGNFLFVDAMLNGTTGVDTGVSGMRIWRAKVISSGSGQTNAGEITIRWISTTANVFAVMPLGHGQTAISNFTIPEGYTGYLKRYAATMDDNTSNSGEMAIKVREFGSNTFRFSRPFRLSTEKNFDRDIFGGIEYAEKTDFCFRALSVANNNAIVTVDYDLLLVKN